MPSNLISFDVNGLYILLSDIGAESQFHWGLYLATASKEGIIFHVVNGPQTGYNWEYQRKKSYNVPSSLTLLVGMKIAVMEPLLHEALAERLDAVPVAPSSRYGAITCRVWVKEALHALDDEGYIKLTTTVDMIEDEVTFAATENKSHMRRTTARSRGSIA
ncbi:hypothetical protein M430DRAFT_29373 [Amorphotheca resinae ATCC 22711]|jgi:hypothetical protein|uniref:Uncharacterized protein n=1 Tax=Amorphotheca resinae ATCC 22711 TaxID=857342 RepID=A0A2T3AVS9_AMORE|nr:hypothetical protein M430DRAFT_29373 [Amorphotheca resinae ATCC 22711]PSS12784.1 hypothetical protein M430DRAFT_29373 [Amorphotheca resinae ATCC 22711]